MSVSGNNTKGDADLFEIYTLGKFELYKNKKLISGSSHRSVRMWNLFKYIITHKDKLITPSELIDNLWQDEDVVNPEKALQNLVYRLRNTLVGDDEDSQDKEYIIFLQGCYKWNNDLNFWIDSAHLRELYSRAKNSVDTEPEEAMRDLENILSIYQGSYLSDLAYELWVVPARNQLQQMYIESASMLIDIYRRNKEYAKALKVCEDVTKIELYEEWIHVCYLDALVELNRKKQALSHYEYITALLFKDLGVKPSQAMKEAYRRIKSGDDGFNSDLSAIQNSLSGSADSEGAFFCDAEIFQAIYRFESRHMARSGLSLVLALLSITRENFGIPEMSKLDAAMSAAKEELIKLLRRSDIITRWDKNQFVLILTSLTLEDAERVLLKVTKVIKEKINDKSLEISYKAYSLMED